MKNVLLGVCTILTIGLISYSCRKENISNFDNEQTTSEDITAHQDLTELIEQDVSEYIDEFGFNSSKERDNCPIVTLEQPKGVWPNKITLDYSETGCTKAGRTYKGIVIIDQTGPMDELGSIRQITFNNFFVEGVKIEGSKTITNIQIPSQGLASSYLIQVDQTLLYPNGSSATFQSTRTRTWLTGENTAPRIDDSWQITGEATGVNRNNQPYTVTITTPLVKKFSCNWISRGEVSLTMNNKTATINYGTGTCDRDAQVTFPNGNSKEIKIKHYWWR
jgi:hypothetical protein